MYILSPSNQIKVFTHKNKKLEKHLIESGIEYDQIIKSINNLNSSNYIRQILQKNF